ncbi:MAG TPA: hypothetical protein VMH87_19915 [Pseudomonadales bacterium]|nr:hypothetical protein [Pseudomonadales bacterium]
MRRNVFGFHAILITFFSLFVVVSQAEKAQADFLSLPPASSRPRVISQHDIGDCACGPCAVFNALEFGDPALNNLAAALPGHAPADKVRALIQQYGGQPSIVTRNQPRYLDNGGMWEDDLVSFINDCLKTDSAAPVRGDHLTRQANETGTACLRRVYDELSHSLTAGFPPVVNLQAYTEHKNFFHRYWKWMDGHFVTVVAVQNTLPQDASKFSMSVADSQSGRILEVSVYADQNRQPASLARTQTQRSGKVPAQVARDYPCLTIQSPKLEGILEGPANSAQTICVIDYAVHR